jgi:hypothetical protein
VAPAALQRNRVDHVVTVPDWCNWPAHCLNKGVDGIRVVPCANETRFTVAAG